MSLQRFPITKEGYRRMEVELAHLKQIERPAIIQAIAIARAHGDLSENAEYSAAKEKQGFIEAKIKDLEEKISFAEIIDISTINPDTVKFGTTVNVMDEDTEKCKEYKIVGDYESDIDNGLLSISSPLAKALLGKKEGESVEINTPGGIKYYEIQSINLLKIE